VGRIIGLAIVLCGDYKMSYRALRFLTLIWVLCALAGVPLAAQRDIVKRELDSLASPVALDRTRAIARLATIQEDIGADLRVAYKFGDLPERLGLLKAVFIRNDNALVQYGAEGLSDADERIVEQAREYLLKLAFEELAADTTDFTDEQAEAWHEFISLRIRRDIALALLNAHVLPGKYLGQFDELRRFDAARLDRELLAVMAADPAFAEPLNLASEEAIRDDIPAERAFQAPWRRLQTAAGAFAPAFEYLCEMEATDSVKSGISLHGRASYFAALEVSGSIRAAAVRALAESPQGNELSTLLNAYYGKLIEQEPDPELGNLVNLDDLRTEVELTLSRFGDDRLLAARIEGLRGEIERVAEAKANVNMQVASRPDLVAQNQIAHLLLRAGDAEGAEAEWSAAVETGLAMLGTADGRNRSSLSSYLAAVYYNLACAQSLQSKLTKGLVSLREAVRYGYRDFGWMLEDGDLDAVRAGESFREWFADTAPPSVADRVSQSR
jgi:hypothetical protein